MTPQLWAIHSKISAIAVKRFGAARSEGLCLRTVVFLTASPLGVITRMNRDIPIVLFDITIC